MLGPFETVQILFIGLIWLVPLAITFWVLRTLSRIARGVERIASALEERTAAQLRGP